MSNAILRTKRQLNWVDVKDANQGLKTRWFLSAEVETHKNIYHSKLHLAQVCKLEYDADGMANGCICYHCTQQD